MLWNIWNIHLSLFDKIDIVFATDVLVEINILLCTGWSLFQLGMNMLQKCQVQGLPGLIMTASRQCAMFQITYFLKLFFIKLHASLLRITDNYCYIFRGHEPSVCNFSSLQLCQQCSDGSMLYTMENISLIFSFLKHQIKFITFKSMSII